MEPRLEVEKYRWLGTKVKLDLLSLEDEITEMPELIRIGGEITAEALAKVNTAKATQKEVRALVAMDLRRTPGASGKTRSESQIESELDGMVDVMETTKELNGCQADAGLWEALMESLMNKSYSISTSVELIKAGYITQDHFIDKRREELRKR